MKKITGYIQTYSHQARDLITAAGMKTLARSGLESLSTELFSCVDEVIKNAVKANYKFVLVRDRIRDRLMEQHPALTGTEIEHEIQGILRVQESYDYIAEDILMEEDISGAVRRILDQEAKLLTIKNRCYQEKRTYNENEKTAIHGLTDLNRMRKRIRETGIKIILKVSADNDFVYIEITNTAPILTRDLNRIYLKREEHLHCKNEGREYEFFVNNLDTSDSGFGLGYAKIDSILASWGLDTERAARIISSIDTTVMITLPIEDLRSIVH